MKEYEVNDYITLKLIENETVIYINGEWFDQCKHVLIRKEVNELENILEIDSVDELAALSLQGLGEKTESINIPADVRFWVHCSNLQVWAEQGYDTRLIYMKP